MVGRWNNANKKPPRRAAKEPPGVTPLLIEPQPNKLVNRPPTNGDWSYLDRFANPALSSQGSTPLLTSR